MNIAASKFRALTGVTHGSCFLLTNYIKRPSSFIRRNTHVHGSCGDGRRLTNANEFPFQLPTSQKLLRRNNFVVLYDQSKRIPLLVAETLTKDSLRGETKRCSKFHEEICIPDAFRSTREDFKNSGFDRGHMAPAGNNKQSTISMKQTFSLANIVPQNRLNNQGIWNELEIYCRNLTQKWDAVHVITGHVMKPTRTKDINGNDIKVVTYQVIGEREVAVPTHLFKAILCLRRKSKDEEGTQLLGDRNKDSDEVTEVDTVDREERFDNELNGEREKVQQNEEVAQHPPPPNYPYPYTRDRPIHKELRLHLESYMVPNCDVGKDKNINDFRTSIRTIEKYSGLELFAEWRRFVEDQGNLFGENSQLTCLT